MWKQFWILLLALSLVPFFADQGRAQNRSANLREDIELPPDFNMDFQLGSAQRSQIRANARILVGTPLNDVGEEVFHDLVGNSMIAGMLVPYRWRFTIIDNNAINAHALPDGEIAVYGGLAQLLGTRRGLWAAVLSHETAHTARRHGVRQYLYERYVAREIAYWEGRVRSGDKSANWGLLAIQIAAPIARAKFSRNLEHDADLQGMMLMARAGYHPDNVFAVHHLMRLATGEKSKFEAFFSGHPRWETRSQRGERPYAEALAEFNRLWADPALSPGGLPPVVVFLAKPTSKENKKSKTADVQMLVACRNTQGQLTLLVRFSKDRKPVPSSRPEYANEFGILEYHEEVDCVDQDEAFPFTVRFPAEMVLPRYRKMKAQVEIFGPRGEILERSSIFDVHLPKR